MTSPNAERQRRWRARRKAHGLGDHSLCPDDCDVEPVAVTQPDVTRNAVTPRLGPRGRHLWQQMTSDGSEMRPGERVLLEEACRIADRLDKLDALLDGTAEDWVSLVETKGHPDRQEVVIDRPLAEARQQATALKQILAELRQSQAGGAGKPASDTSGGGRVPAGVTSLAARIAAKRGSSTAG